MINNYKLDKNSKLPLYFQLNEKIMEDIKAGKLKTGDYLPTEDEFCSSLNISRGTVRQAINLLVEKGYVVRQRGKGTTVKPMTLNHDLIGDYSFGKGIERLGMHLTCIVLSIEVNSSKKSIRDRLGMEDKGDVIHISRLRCANGEPWICEDSYLEAGKFPGLQNENIYTGLLIDILADKYKTVLSKIDAFVEPTLVDEKHARLMRLTVGSPAMSMDRILYGDDGTPAVYCHAFVRGDRCRYYFNVSR